MLALGCNAGTLKLLSLALVFHLRGVERLRRRPFHNSWSHRPLQTATIVKCSRLLPCHPSPPPVLLRRGAFVIVYLARGSNHEERFAVSYTKASRAQEPEIAVPSVQDSLVAALSTALS